MDLRRRGKLRLSRHGRQDLIRRDRYATFQKRTQYIIYSIKPFVFGGVQQFQVLFDRRSLRRPLEKLVVGHANRVNKGRLIVDSVVLAA